MGHRPFFANPGLLPASPSPGHARQDRSPTYFLMAFITLASRSGGIGSI